MSDSFEKIFGDKEPAPEDFTPRGPEHIFAVVAVYTECISGCAEVHYGYYKAHDAEDLRKAFPSTSVNPLWEITPVSERVKPLPSTEVKAETLQTLVRFARCKRVRYS